MERTFAKVMHIISLGLFLTIGLSSGFPSRAMGADTVKIGLLEILSGPSENVGRLYTAAVQFAVDEQNAKGGLLGKQIELVLEDSEVKPDVATRKAKKLILEGKVNFLGTGSGSGIAIALNKVATTYKIVTINHGGMADICQGKEFSRYSFRVCMNSYALNAALTQLMITKPYRKFYILCQDYAWGHDAGEAFKKELKKYLPDAKIVGEDYHPLMTKDFGPYITKVMSSKADAIFTGNWGSDARLLVKQARSLGLKAPFPFIMPLGVDPYTMNEVKEDAVGIHLAYAYTGRVKTPENEEMVAKYHEKHKRDKDFLTWWPEGAIGVTILGYNMFFAAVEKAKSLDSEKVIGTLEGFRYKTPVGWWEMRKCDHQVLVPIFGGELQSKNPYFDGSIRPEVKFPWLGSDITTFPATAVSIPPTPDYNPRCP